MPKPPRCAVCGTPVPYRATHQWGPRYCSGACRVAAFRSRRQEAGTTPGTTTAGNQPAGAQTTEGQS